MDRNAVHLIDTPFIEDHAYADRLRPVPPGERHHFVHSIPCRDYIVDDNAAFLIEPVGSFPPACFAG